jgi:FMN phosphatase YigB (HAD superfamily)
MATRWLVFDVDDTLVDTFGTALEKYRIIATRLGVPVPTAADLSASGYGVVPFDDCASRLLPTISLTEIRSRYDKLAADVRPVPLSDLRPVLAAAAGSGWRVGIFTNGPASKTALKLTAAGVSATDVDSVLTSDDTPVRKPSPAAFRWLCGRLGISRRSGWYVSDAPADWLGCEEAGLNSVGVVRRQPPLPGCQAVPRLALVSCADLASLVVSLPEMPAGAVALAAVRAVTLDAGWTLLRARRSVAACLTAALPGSEPDTIGDHLEQAINSAIRDGLPAGTWTSDTGNFRYLTAVYETALRQCGALATAEVAASGLTRYLAPENWALISAGRGNTVRDMRQSGIPLAVVSNWQTSLARTIAEAGLADCSIQIVASCAEGMAKPAAGLFAAAARRIGVRLEELLHVGDDPRTDINGALLAGCHAAFAEPEHTDEAFAALIQLGSAWTRRGEEI